MPTVRSFDTWRPEIQAQAVVPPDQAVVPPDTDDARENAARCGYRALGAVCRRGFPPAMRSPNPPFSRHPKSATILR